MCAEFREKRAVSGQGQRKPAFPAMMQTSLSAKKHGLQPMSGADAGRCPGGLRGVLHLRKALWHGMTEKRFEDARKERYPGVGVRKGCSVTEGLR